MIYYLIGIVLAGGTVGGLRWSIRYRPRRGRGRWPR